MEVNVANGLPITNSLVQPQVHTEMADSQFIQQVLSLYNTD